MQLLAEAFEDACVGSVEEDEDDQKGDLGIQGDGGPYGTILHTAAVVGSYWIIKFQLEAGVEVSAFDYHFWTPLMVATAQGHANCAKLLSKHMEPKKINAAPQPRPPSALVKAERNMPIVFGPENLTAEVSPWSSPRLKYGIQIRSNHPIPPDLPNFYFEMQILRIGSLGCVQYVLYMPMLQKPHVLIATFQFHRIWPFQS